MRRNTALHCGNFRSRTPCTLPQAVLARLVLLAFSNGKPTNRGAILCRTYVFPCSCTFMYTPVGKAAFFAYCLQLSRKIPLRWVYGVALRQSSVTYVYVRSLGLSSRALSCLQLSRKFRLICGAIHCRTYVFPCLCTLCTLPSEKPRSSRIACN